MYNSKYTGKLASISVRGTEVRKMEKNDLNKMIAYKNHLDQVADYFATNGYAALEAGKDVSNIEALAWKYLIDSLDVVAENVTSMASLVEEEIDKEVDKVEALGTQINLIKSQVELGKEYFMRQRLKGVIASSSSSSNNNNSNTNNNNSNNPVLNVPSEDLLTEDDFIINVPTFQDRINKYESVGISM